MNAPNPTDVPLGLPVSLVNPAADAEAPALEPLSGDAEARRFTGGQMDDADLTFLSELLSPEPQNLSIVPVANVAPSPSSSIHSADSHISADSTMSPEELNSTRGAQRNQESSPELENAQVGDRGDRRRLLSAKNARIYRSRKKTELVTLREQVHRFEEQLKALRLRHKVLRADSAVACWEEKAIAQRLKRRQAEEINDQLQQALFAHTGYVKDFKSIFTESAPPSTALNMRDFLHKYTHLRKDPQLRARDLEAVGTAAKLDRAMQVVLRETSTIPASTSPEILFQELNLDAEGLGKTSTAVYAFNTRNASNAFDVACKAILSTCGVWPDHTRVETSTKFFDVPPTQFNVLYSMTKHRSCGVLVWDFVDADDLYPLKGSTFIKRNTVGALVLRPEVCPDGVERMVCRSICTDMQILVNMPKLALKVAEFARLEDMMLFETIKKGATDWQDACTVAV
ncbi:hypothetical protein PF005_g238 [Phytophthora fragariae]|uniref:BZIP domain-containing protein n=1 Tax=Phytophthora fragariae TaxID=53985 RepID=A0A6A3G7R9_9STRA|nr:hypothetical protein PF003_g8320 [Phytophthora fragariae]KAE8950028.1 hypothetical protein PF009_g421 [Phytophthora fragariae]KAE9031298.1 hypothetical protein PF011_g195 [Phytophthora fragariae]KAE9140373.1 hypothetical protein PF010_g237 [Phytophthora fragariae]KAE9141084.1 hypothetical protein PF007_g382 [Phytophthora fragariae]